MTYYDNNMIKKDQKKTIYNKNVILKVIPIVIHLSITQKYEKKTKSTYEKKSFSEIFWGC